MHCSYHSQCFLARIWSLKNLLQVVNYSEIISTSNGVKTYQISWSYAATTPKTLSILQDSQFAAPGCSSSGNPFRTSFPSSFPSGSSLSHHWMLMPQSRWKTFCPLSWSLLTVAKEPLSLIQSLPPDSIVQQSLGPLSWLPSISWAWPTEARTLSDHPSWH